MQEKLIDILSRATAWMTAAQIAEAGGWRSHANVGVALGQIEKATGTVERRKSPTQLQSNGMPATEWKLTDKKIKDATESKMGRKPKFPPLEPATKATDLSEKLADVQRELDHANAANASWLKLAAEHARAKTTAGAIPSARPKATTSSTPPFGQGAKPAPTLATW